MDSQGMAMFKMQGDRVEELTVSDPSRKLNRIIVTVSGIYESRGDGFITHPDTGKGNTLILVDLPQGVYAGKSVTLRLDWIDQPLPSYHFLSFPLGAISNSS